MYPELRPLSMEITEQEILADLSWPFPLPGDWQPVRPSGSARRSVNGKPSSPPR